jgi:adenylate cyclase
MAGNGRWSFVYLVAVVAGFLAFTLLLHMPHDLEHWSADLMISNFSGREAHQDKRIALVYVSESTLARCSSVSSGDCAYLSPIDRGLLAQLIGEIDNAGAAVIGLDIILDRYTEPKKDNALRTAIRNAKAKMVLGAVQEAPGRPNAQADFFFANATGNGPSIGHVYLDQHPHNRLTISDHVVRFLAPPFKPGQPYLDMRFAEAVAYADSRTDFTPKSHYIDWLLRPADGTDTFLTLQAEDILGLGKQKLPAADLLKGKIVLIGGNFEDRDQHLTPLSASRDDFFPGLFIQAQILAQLLDQRSIYEVSYLIEAILALCAAYGGYALGRRAGHLYLWLELASVATLVLIGIIAFWAFRIIFPYNVVLIAWLAGAAAGHYGRLNAKPASQTKVADGGENL